MNDDVDLEALFRRRQQEVFVYFVRNPGDAWLAEELAQETFVRAFGAVVRFRGDASLRTWLFGIARNVLH
ncbi:sigma factor, partial [uncultured Reyranella sp.]|uniref:RNA polymerase sigma factor n=1 Tax=uncultured Reyranella sp. TaxID=735512 RepID=UPI00259CE602